MKRLLSLTLITLATSCLLHGQNRIGTGGVLKLYEQNCASCHGADLEGGLGGPLIGDNWDYVKDYDDMAEYIARGNLEEGMPVFSEILSGPEIRSLVIFIREMNAKAKAAESVQAKSHDGVFKSEEATFRVENVVEGLKIPWSMAFMPDGRLLITERGGNLRFAKDGKLSKPIAGTPEVLARGQGGLLEVALHPDYAENGWIYLGFTEKGEQENHDRDVGMTKIVRGRIDGDNWVDQEVIFEVPSEFYTSAGHHFGTRFVFQDGDLYFSIGDRGRQQMAQDLTRPNGKIHRIHDDGRIPRDNPFYDKPGAYQSIWTYGSRNPQGLDAHPVTGDIWEAEHGPRGGDEVNRITKGRNYGWPVITYGMNYNGTPITDKTHAPGMEQPIHYWVPSIAVCGIDFYEGDKFPGWKNNLFAGGLASRELHRLVIEDGKITKDEIVLKGLGRVRDVAAGPDGYLYLVLNGPDKIVRLEVVE